jgi:hypothetical protein
MTDMTLEDRERRLERIEKLNETAPTRRTAGMGDMGREALDLVDGNFGKITGVSNDHVRLGDTWYLGAHVQPVIRMQGKPTDPPASSGST